MKPVLLGSQLARFPAHLVQLIDLTSGQVNLCEDELRPQHAVDDVALLAQSQCPQRLFASHAQFVRLEGKQAPGEVGTLSQ